MTRRTSGFVSHGGSVTLDRRGFVTRVTRFGAAGLAAGLFPAVPALSDDWARYARADALVETSSGTVRGLVSEGVNVFKGVPYGAPTGGVNRFMPPLVPEAWAGIRDVFEYGPNAPQGAAAAGSEDCLVLNVWSPGLGDGGDRPVMVWLHGGGFSSLSGSSPTYDGTNLCLGGDVVVVTINHRLNVFGSNYLAESLGSDFAYSGCVGMLDIVASLEWVRDNIEGFGGDPGNVTVFGESGGGRKVSVLLAMPTARGLFHQAIIESGAVLKVTSRVDGDRLASRLLDQLGLSNARAREIQAIPAPQLIGAYQAALRGFEPRDPIIGTVPGTPVLDGVAIPHHPFDPLATPASAEVPVIVGYNRTEETFVYLNREMELDLDESGLRRRVEERIGTTVEPSRVIDAYRRAHPNARPWDLYILIATDHPRGMFARELAKRKSHLRRAPAYLYRFDFDLGGELGTPHAVEIPFVFDNIERAGTRFSALHGNPQAHALAAKMSAAWMAFARYGDPSTPDLPPWPRYSTRLRPTMLFNDASRVASDPDRRPRLIMEEVLDLL